MGLNVEFGAGGEWLGGAVGADEGLAAGLAGAAAVETEGTGFSMLGEEGEGEGAEELELADEAVAAGVATFPAGVGAEAELMEADGVALFEDLGVGDGGVGHVGVETAGTGVIGSGTGTAADGLVVAKGGVAKEEVVHGALAAGLEVEGFEEGVDEALADFDIPTDDGGVAGGIVGELRVQQAGGEVDVDGFENAFVQGKVGAEEDAEDVEDGAADDGVGGVEIAGMHGGGAVEVEVEPVLATGDPDLNEGTVVEGLGRLAGFRKLGNFRAHHSGRVLEDVGHRGA